MLSDLEARKAKPKDNSYKLADERGLYLLVNPNSGKLWRMNYRLDGKQKILALGIYPDVSLKEAREKRVEARKLLWRKGSTRARSGRPPGPHRPKTSKPSPASG